MSRTILLKAPAFAAISSMALLFLALFQGWMGPPTGAGANFCEVRESGIILQPANTWSNLAYLVAGLLIAWRQYKGENLKNNIFNNSLFFQTSFVTMLVLICPGSMAMHATTTDVGGFFDMLSMYMLASYMASYGLMRLVKWGEKGFVISFVLFMTYCLTFHFQEGPTPFLENPGTFAFATVLLVSAVSEHIYSLILRARITIGWGIASMATFAIAFFIWRHSVTGSPYCDPSSLVQGHAIWHILSAVAVYWLYRYYVSEEDSTAKAR